MLEPPTPAAPDAGLGGWFAGRPASSSQGGTQGIYSEYGYAGYAYTTYDIEGGCLSTLIAPEFKFETTIANGEFMVATAIIGASNALRERAWEPASMWSWADPLVEQGTRAVYDKVFSVFGIITLCVVGIYLLWRSQQADMSNTMTTAGWALLVMVAVTALAAWPVKSANIADSTLITSLNVIHTAVGPRPEAATPSECRLGDPEACRDNRPPAVRASDTVTESMLYRNWLRGMLGSADSDTAKKYGFALYDARSLTWDEAEKGSRKRVYERRDYRGKKNASGSRLRSKSKKKILKPMSIFRAPKAWSVLGRASLRCWQPCCSRSSTSRPRSWYCSAS